MLRGPEPFMAEVKNALRELGFDLAKLHSESFGRGRVARGVKGVAKSLTLSGPRHKICFTKTGLTVDTGETVTLLELAEAHGIEINYACRIGERGECEVKFAGKSKENGLAAAPVKPTPRPVRLRSPIPERQAAASPNRKNLETL